ncbi:hypothetical protein [Deinococcus altitudinis]|uniref:hypothetical protein n=1 Tax=Deinococcus altitudinis TaxID=468914 RepID=UPI00389250CD
MTLLGRRGNPDNAPFIIPVSAYEADPRAFHVEVMSALMMDPAAELMLGLELLSMAERTHGWLHLA